MGEGDHHSWDKVIKCVLWPVSLLDNLSMQKKRKKKPIKLVLQLHPVILINVSS